MDIGADDLLLACVNSLERLKVAIDPTHLAYLLLTGTCENTIRDLLACELLARGMLPARDWEDRTTGGRMLIDIALLDPSRPNEKPVRLIELKWQNSKDCKRRTSTYPYLINVQRDFDKRTSLGIPLYGVVLFTHVRGKPDIALKRLIRFAPALVSGRDCGDDRLDHFRAQLHRDYPACRITPGPAEPLCRFDGGSAWNTPVELLCWVLEPCSS